MKSSERNPLESIPLFPLPGAVLFPGQRLPLRIFEPRYRKMMQDALGGARQLCIVHLKSNGTPERGSQTTPGGTPAFHEIGGVGRIVHHEQLDSGNYNLILEGESRVRVQEVASEAPYRCGDLQVLETSSGTVNAGESRALRHIAERLVSAIREVHPQLNLDLPPSTSPERLADACCQHFVTDADQQQVLLEELNDGVRVSLCLEFLMRQFGQSGSTLN